MNKSKLLFLQILGIALTCGAGAASAADEVNPLANGILFKIHDVVPVKSSSGLVTGCDFGATFYNRTPNAISDAQINLMWEDEVISDTIDLEKREAKEALRSKRSNTARYNTSTYNTVGVSMPLRLPPLKSNQQVTLKSKINTDRCFLLMNEVDVKVVSCRIIDAKSKTGSVGNNAKACDDLFRFVSDKNPEYYTEFKEVSLEEENLREKDAFEKQKDELSSIYSDAANTLNSLASSLRD